MEYPKKNIILSNLYKTRNNIDNKYNKTSEYYL